MDVFQLRGRLVEDYARYTRSFIKIAVDRIKARVDRALNGGQLWPEPLPQLDPAFLLVGRTDGLVKACCALGAWDRPKERASQLLMDGRFGAVWRSEGRAHDNPVGITR